MLFVAPAAAQFAEQEDTVGYRKNMLFVMHHNLDRTAAVAAGKASIDTKVAADSAGRCWVCLQAPVDCFWRGC